MNQVFGSDNIPTIVVASTTSVTLAATNNGSATTITIGGQQYTLSSQLTLTATTTGANGLDTGSLASNGTYYVYAIVNSTSFAVALIGSTSNPSSGPTIPSGYSTAFKEVGVFNTNGSSQIGSTAFIPLGPISWTNSAGTLQIGNLTNAGAWQLGPFTASLTQTTSTVSTRATNLANFGNSLEWGHPNQAGYSSVLGYQTGGGTPFIGFSCESDANNPNKFTTRGFVGNILSAGTGNGFQFIIVPNSNASNQSGTVAGSMNNNGAWVFGSTSGAVVTTNNHFIQNTASGGVTLNVINAGGASPFGMIVQFSAAAPNNGSVYFFRCTDNAADRLFIYSNGGIANFSANNSNLSDQRIKTNITTTPSQLNFINALQVKDFEYLDAPGRTVTGLIAQDVEVLDSTLVSENGGEYTIDGYTFTAKTIHESQIYYRLLKAVQELSTEVTTLKARIDGYGIP